MTYNYPFNGRYNSPVLPQVLGAANFAYILERAAIDDGQSNYGNSQGIPSNHEGTMSNVYTHAQSQQYGAAARATPTTTFNWNQALRDLQPFGTSGQTCMGQQLSMLRAITQLTPCTRPLQQFRFGVDGSPTAEQLTFPLTGAGSYNNIKLTNIAAFLSNVSKQVGIWLHGHLESDAGSDPNAAAMRTNLDAQIGTGGTIPTALGYEDFVRVVPQLPDEQAGGLSGVMTQTRLDTVNGHISDFCAADPNYRLMIPKADISLASHRSGSIASMNYLNVDLTHWNGNGQWVIGNIIGEKIAEKAYPNLIPFNRAMSNPGFPWVQSGDSDFCMPSIGSNTANSGNYKLVAPYRNVNGEIHVMAVTNGVTVPVTAPALTSAEGFTQVRASDCTVSTSTERSAVFSRIVANGAIRPNDPIVTDDPLATGTSGQKQGLIFSIRGSSGLHMESGGSNNNNTTVVSHASGLTTTVPNCLVVWVICCFSSTAGSSVGSPVNANVSNLRMIRNAKGPASHIIAIAVGEKATPGAIGTFTATRSHAGLTNVFCLVFAP